jgi:ABC-type dipeptide/oligopeptide/nickel transport system ATPase component
MAAQDLIVRPMPPSICASAIAKLAEVETATVGTGCRFAPRCAERVEGCSSVDPDLLELSPGHRAACLRLQPESAAQPKESR